MVLASTETIVYRHIEYGVLTEQYTGTVQISWNLAYLNNEDCLCKVRGYGKLCKVSLSKWLSEMLSEWLSEGWYLSGCCQSCCQWAAIWVAAVRVAAVRVAAVRVAAVSVAAVRVAAIRVAAVRVVVRGLLSE